MKNIKPVIIAGVVTVAAFSLVMVFKSCNKEKQVEPTPDTTPSVEDYYNVSFDPSTEAFETFAPIEVPEGESGAYLNNKTLSLIDKSGKIFTVGVNEKSENSDRLILNPNYSGSSPENKVGYYVWSTSNPNIITSSDEFVRITQKNPDEETKKIINDLNSASNVIFELGYDTLKTAEYNEKHFGIAWKPEYEIDGDTIRFVAVDFTTGHVLSSVSVDVVRNEKGLYELNNLRSNDVRDCGIDVDCNQLLKKTQENIETGTYVVSTEKYTLDDAIIEKIEHQTYPKKFVKPNGKNTPYGLMKYPIYAVTVNSKSTVVGHITMYYDAETLEFVGYDYISPKKASEVDNY